jgi:Asp/Glu/hydantoin racemase
MKSAPKIYLVHAAVVSIPPIVASFRAAWPQAQLANLLEDSFMPDLAADGRLTDEMIGRFVHIGHYCVKAGADAILFACSAFGPAIEECRRQLKIPVLKPNEAMYEQLVAKDGSVSLLATFPPSIPSMVTEINDTAKAAGRNIQLNTHLVEGALAALQSNNPDEHNRLIVEFAAKQRSDIIAFAQFSMAPALKLAAARTKTPILTTPDSAVAKLKTMLA